MLLALALVASACGDDDATDATTGATQAPAATEAPAPTGASDPSGFSEERCAANAAYGTVTFVTGFDFAAAAGIIDVIAADGEGYFEELCIDVDVQPGFAPSNGALVIEGQAQFGESGSFGELVSNNLAGEGDLVAVMHWGRTAIEGLVVPEGSEIQSFGDLCGSVVGIKGDLPRSLAVAVAIAGIERSCFEEILLDGFDPIAHLALGIDALPVYKSNEPNTLTQNDVAFTLLDPKDFDIPASFGMTFTSRTFMNEYPDLAQDIVRALAKGNEFAQANPQAAVDHAFNLIDAAGNPLFFAKAQELYRWNTESGLITELTPAGQGPGIPDLFLLGAEVQAMTDAGLFDALPDWESMVDTSLAESIYDGTSIIWPAG
jgi:NitT/TauT family transport system substrate-binding protein